MCQKNNTKEQTLANFQADHPIPAKWELARNLIDENSLLIEMNTY